MDDQIRSLERAVESQKIAIAKLSKDSSNSSKRPSSDDITKAKQRRKKGKRKIGGQSGHPRHQRSLFPEEAIDIFHSHALEICPVCNGGVTVLDLEPRITQQVELEEIVTRKEEHRCYAVWCPKCQKIHRTPLPPDVAKEAFFKVRVTAAVAYMSNVCHASFSTIRKFFRDIIGIRVSRGYLAKVIQKGEWGIGEAV